MAYEAPKLNEAEPKVQIDYAQAEFEMRRRKAADDAGILDDTTVTWNDVTKEWLDKWGIPLEHVKELNSGNDNSDMYKPKTP